MPLQLPSWSPIDKGDLAILISLASASFTYVQAYYQRGSYRLQRQQAKRKPPVFEPVVQPWSGHPGWSVIEVTIRNMADVTVDINRVSARHPKKLRLFEHDRYLVSTPMGGQILTAPPPLVDGAPSLELDIHLRPASDRPVPDAARAPHHMAIVSALACAGETRIRFIAHGSAGPGALQWSFSWADGEPA